MTQSSSRHGDIPKEWTLANISPFIKKGDRSLACNYRPVSLTCVPCKLLEHIVHVHVCSNIMPHLDEHKLLSDKQHAFRKWHSCETQLATVINNWAKILDNKGPMHDTLPKTTSPKRYFADKILCRKVCRISAKMPKRKKKKEKKMRIDITIICYYKFDKSK